MESEWQPDINWKDPDWKQVVKDMEAELDQQEVEQEDSTAEKMERFDFYRQFIQARNEKKLTQAQLAKLVGTTQAKIALLESGNGNPTYKTLVRVAEVLDCRLTLARR
jgi:DNA-binding XRE family transcriptional regulator